MSQPATTARSDAPGLTQVAAERPSSSSALERCDPSVLLLVVVAVPVALMRVHDPVPLVGLWLAAAVAVLLGTRVGVRGLLAGQLPFASFAASLLLVNAVTRDGEVLSVVAGMPVTDVGLRTGAGLAVRTLVVGVCATGFLASVDPGRLLSSLHGVARVPIRPCCALLAAHRLLDDLPVEWTTVRRAHAVRRSGHGRLSRSPVALGRAAFVLLVTSIRRAERVALSLESRGLGALSRAERTTWRAAAVGPRDAVVVLAAGAAVAAVVLVSRP